MLCLCGVDVSHGEEVFGGTAGSDELGEVQGATVAVDDAAADFEGADAGFGTREAHVALDGEFCARAGGEAVDLADEDGGEGVEEADDGNVEVGHALAEGGVEGGGGGCEFVDVDVGDEDVGVGGGEDENFWGSGGGLEGGEEGVHVEDDFVVEELDGGVCDGGADDEGVHEGGGEGAVAGGGVAG